MSIKNKESHTQSGNAIVIVLVILVIAAIGGLGYLSTQTKDGDKEHSTTEVAATAETSGDETAVKEEAAANEIKPGNPVVAKLDGQDITRQEIFAFIQKTFPPQMLQMPLEQLFPMATEQMINTKIMEAKTKGVNLDSDPEVKKQLAAAKEQIVKTVYLQNKINEKLTEDRIKKSYDDYVEKFPKEEEVKASHILVEDEEIAKEVIVKLIETGDFAALAKEYSKDATAANGGDLGYFVKGDVVKEFSEASFSMEPGTYTKEPVKTQFGYHIIRVEAKRMREPKSLEEIKPALEGDLRRVILDEILQAWKEKSKIELFDINGDAIEPAAGE